MSDTVRSGVGVHGGRSATVRLHRADGPVRFRVGRTELRADWRRVVSTRGATVLGDDGVRLATVEHLLAALHVRSVFGGLVIEVDGDELPILDGSAAPWDEVVTTLGPYPPAPTPVAGDAQATSDDRWARLTSGDRWLHVTVAYDHPAVARMSWSGGPERWPDLLAARTFGFARDAERLHAAGLARGSSERNAIVYHDDGPLPSLRCPDEPVRHKALDALGDLYLLGAPFAGRLVLHRAGHDLHHALVRRLASLGDATAPPHARSDATTADAKREPEA
ncbi:MAG: UDP-3-O-acyl-N-acetylglucosamine deacetylase [Trueperaceae bacterium]